VFKAPWNHTCLCSRHETSAYCRRGRIMHCQVWRDRLVEEESRPVRSIYIVVQFQFVENTLRAAYIVTSEWDMTQQNHGEKMRRPPQPIRDKREGNAIIDTSNIERVKLRKDSRIVSSLLLIGFLWWATLIKD
jgi:hypothetical protein